MSNRDVGNFWKKEKPQRSKALRCGLLRLCDGLIAEEAHHIVIAHVLRDTAQCVIISVIFAALHILPEQIAKDAAEILVPCVAQKAAGISEHTEEVA